MNLDELNLKMISDGLYNERDMRDMQKISMLKEKNDYDYYLIVCALCNYKLPEKEELMELRMEYFHKINGTDIDYSHKSEDYNMNVSELKTQCKNTGVINKFGLYVFEVNSSSKDLVNTLWDYKAKDCLKYVDNKTHSDKILISIRKEQFDNFIKMLDTLTIGYDIEDLKSNMFYNNTSDIKLVDFDKLTLPFELYPYQIEDANKIVTMKRALLGSDMGCGKTVISILVGQSIDMPKLVICPESLRRNWLREIQTVVPNVDAQILLSNEEFHFGKDWTIIGYQTATKFMEQLKQFKCIFVDEAQYCKAVNNWGKPTSKRASAVIDLANNATYCYLLTGTPLPSHNKDLFNILKMLKCPEFDFNNQWAFKGFADKYCDPKDTFFGKDYNGNSNSEQLHNTLKPLMIRRLKKDVLPHLKKQRQFIPIAPTFKRDYKAIIQKLLNMSEDDTYMGLAMTGRQMLSQYKIDSAIDLAESMLDAEESVVIVTNFIETADKLKEHFKDIACEIRGGMSDESKQASIDEFQSKKKQVCILNMMAGGVGITLTASHNMIILDYAWLPADMVQVEDRICRTGQTECCNIYYIYCDNSLFDTIFIKMISDKSANIDLVVDDAENTFDLSDTKSRATTYIDILKKELKETKKEAKKVK